MKIKRIMVGNIDVIVDKVDRGYVVLLTKNAYDNPARTGEVKVAAIDLFDPTKEDDALEKAAKLAEFLRD